MTAIYVTHDQAEAMALADRIAVMNQGKIVQFGSPLEVYNRPATTFVANFLGSPPMNLLTVAVSLAGADASFAGDGVTLAAAGWGSTLAGKVRDGDRVVLGARPEHLRLVEAGSGPWTLPGELYAVETLGSEALVTLRVGGVLTTVRIFGDEVPVVPERPAVLVDEAKVHLFRESGERVDLGRGT